ncbi:MAG TPA: M3 family metallopeptidase [Gemmatimonadaceae bacterium]|jgi:peptidyl-dipeptidase Dcp
MNDATASASDNPLLAPSVLPFGAPAFDRIRDEHFLPAIELGMQQQIAEVDAIVTQIAAPTFGNTLEALERTGAQLSRALRAFHAVAGTNTNDTLQELQVEIAPRLAAHSDAIHLDARLFARVHAIHGQLEQLPLSPEQRQLVERYHLDFVRSGANLDESAKEKLRSLNQEESALSAEFQNRLLSATRAAAVVFDDVRELEGLDEADLTAAAQAARDRGLEGNWLLTLQNTTQQPVLESLKRRDVRKRVFEASLHRTDHGSEFDTRDIVRRLASIRAERSRLLGFATTADFTLDDQMAKTPDAAIRLLTDIAKTAVDRAKGEAKRIQAMIDAEGGGFTLEPWDWQYYSERVRRAEFDVDDARIRPYLALDRVMRDGVFFAATQLFGLTFEPRNDIPVYHPDVLVFEVRDADGSPLALLYLDHYKRDNKTGGAWMDAYVDQSRLLGKKPVIVNVTNFTKPAPGKSALIGFDEVTTLFHEFGHALHGMLSDVVYPTLTGTNVPRDFVEFPSQFNEHWALEPAVLARYARHHETGEPMPADLVEKIKKSRKFNQGFALTEYISAALLDMAWHTIDADANIGDVASFETAALQRFGVQVHEVPPRYDSTYFAHVWDGGYEAGYYAYLWAEVLDHDAFAWFNERGGMNRANGDAFREGILSRGGTGDAAELYRRFRGRDPVVDPLLAARGLNSEAGDR